MKSSQGLLDRYREIYAALNRGWSMWWDTSHMQYAAMTGMNSSKGPESIAESVFGIAEQIKKESGWFGELNSSIRFIIAALLDQKGDSADQFIQEVERVKKLFRQHKMSRGGMYEVVAATILRLCGPDKQALQPISDSQIQRLQEIHQAMSKYQWWLTGVDDYPSCAILSMQPGTPLEIAAQAEDIYQALNANGYWRGNPLQDAANLLFLVNDHPTTIASRFHEIAETLRNRKVRIWQSEYDEVAVLTFTREPVESVVDRVLYFQDELRQLKPKINKQVAFNLASSLTFMESVRSRETESVANAKAMIDLNSIIAAQQAAIMAACIGASVAVNTASSSS